MPEPRKPYDVGDYISDIITTLCLAAFTFGALSLFGLVLLDSETVGPVSEEAAAAIVLISAFCASVVMGIVGGEADDKWQRDKPLRRMRDIAEDTKRRQREEVDLAVRDVERFSRR